jgi:hypothetical protein
MTEGQDIDYSKAERLTPSSRRLAQVTRREFVGYDCPHCKRENIGEADARLVKLYDQGARVNTSCPLCRGPVTLQQSSIIKAGSVPVPGGFNPPKGL